VDQTRSTGSLDSDQVAGGLPGPGGIAGVANPGGGASGGSGGVATVEVAVTPGDVVKGIDVPGVPSRRPGS
jgi:hypothetical protein